jgi:leucyl-tRNA synthetase
MMSKSLGNIVEPDEVMALYGPDALRVFILFIGPPEDDYDWPPEGAQAVKGSYDFLERVWRLVTDNLDALRGAGNASGASALRKTVHQKLAEITERFERFAFNTAIARMMELRNTLASAARDGADAAALREGVDVLLHTLAPVAPYITEELWHRLGNGESIHARPWPAADPELAKAEHVTMVVQVDAKVRDRIEVPPDISEEDAIATALASGKVRAHLPGEPAKVIARPPRLVNLLTR